MRNLSTLRCRDFGAYPAKRCIWANETSTCWRHSCVPKVLKLGAAPAATPFWGTRAPRAFGAFLARKAFNVTWASSTRQPRPLAMTRGCRAASALRTRVTQPGKLRVRYLTSRQHIGTKFEPPPVPPRLISFQASARRPQRDVGDMKPHLSRR